MIIIHIANYNDNENSLFLYHEFSKYCKEVYITDSGSTIQDPLFISTGRPYGHLEKIREIVKDKEYKGVLGICGDVLITPENVKNLVEKLQELDNSIGMYSPIVNGKSHNWLKAPMNNSIDEIPFCEGMIYYCSKETLDHIYSKLIPYENPIGFGMDIYYSYLTREIGKRVVIDRTVYVHHCDKTRYDTTQSGNEGIEFIRSKGKDFQDYCRQLIGIVT